MEQYAQILKELGDPKWVEFFKDAKDELNKISELRKDTPEYKISLVLDTLLNQDENSSP